MVVADGMDDADRPASPIARGLLELPQLLLSCCCCLGKDRLERGSVIRIIKPTVGQKERCGDLIEPVAGTWGNGGRDVQMCAEDPCREHGVAGAKVCKPILEKEHLFTNGSLDVSGCIMIVTIAPGLWIWRFR